MDYSAAQSNSRFAAAVLDTAPNTHLRGMDRNSVIIDGTKAGAPQPCDSAPQWQDFGAVQDLMEPGGISTSGTGQSTTGGLLTPAAARAFVLSTGARFAARNPG